MVVKVISGTQVYLQSINPQKTRERQSVRFDPIAHIKPQYKQSCVSSYKPGIVTLSSGVDDLKLREIMEPGQTFYLFNSSEEKTKVTWGKSEESRMDYINKDKERVLISGGCVLVSPELADTYLESKYSEMLERAALNLSGVSEGIQTNDHVGPQIPYRLMKHTVAIETPTGESRVVELYRGGEPGFNVFEITTDDRGREKKTEYEYLERHAVSQLLHMYDELGITHIITTNGRSGVPSEQSRTAKAVRAVNKILSKRNPSEGPITQEEIKVYDTDGRDAMGRRVVELVERGIKPYIHCTAGKHRAPSAALIAMMHLGAKNYEEAAEMIDFDEDPYRPGQELFLKRVQEYVARYADKVEAATQSGSFARQTPEGQDPVTTIDVPQLDENSGIAASFNTENAIWTHNDSGGSRDLYLVSTQTGQVLQTVEVSGATNRDWEDITTFEMGGVPCIAIGDFGDNAETRSKCQIRILREPQLEHGDIKYSPEYWTNIEFEYEDGRSRDAESIAYDLSGNRLLLMEKDSSGKTEIFELPLHSEDTTGVIAKKIGSIDAENFSAMDISRDGTRLFARSYNTGYLFIRGAGESWEDVFAKPLPQPIQLPKQRKGEGVSFEPGKNSILLSSEGKNQPLYRVGLEEFQSPETTQRKLAEHFKSGYINQRDDGAIALSGVEGKKKFKEICDIRDESIELRYEGKYRNGTLCWNPEKSDFTFKGERRSVDHILEDGDVLTWTKSTV